ncbi:MAG: hypothetical protein UR87_C0061G0001, partial [candidate division CPR3 bacterium GW2011_GWE2_35_7]
IFTFGIFIFSLIMAGVASYRNNISSKNYSNTSRIYGGNLNQNAPLLDEIDSESKVYIENRLNDTQIKKYLENTYLTSTNGNVVITADFVKKGLSYQPTFKTDFQSKYILKNNLNEKSFISFEFPFPISSDTNEISNAKLIVNGQEIKNAKTKLTYTDKFSNYNEYNLTNNQLDGFKWEGDIAANSETTVEVSYQTVGLSLFTYEGLENPKGSQDFNFEVKISGTRLYDVNQGLSVDRRNFGPDTVTLIWDKNDLYSKPLVSVQIGEKLNPSTQVSRIYFTMAPIYLVFITIILYLTFVFGKKTSLFDMFLITVLYIVYFPLIHYVSSFTIDPTIEIFSKMNRAIYYSMPLYLAFTISFLIIGGLIYYLLGKTSDFKFATKLGLPSLVLFLGFFPLVVTIPEYSMLMVIIGLVALIMIVLQVRLKRFG